MTTDEVIHELETALAHIEEAKRLSETEVSRIEIHNAKQFCRDAIDGLNMNKVYSEQCRDSQVSVSPRKIPDPPFSDPPARYVGTG